MKNYIKTILLAFALLTTTKANATNPVLCGGNANPNTFDTAGDWDYTWQDRSNPAEFLHGKMHLETCDGYVTGKMDVPVEITDAFQIADWNYQILGTENGVAVMLMAVQNGSTPWFFELQQNVAIGSMAGETFAGTIHTDRNVIFTAKNFSGFGHRALVQGIPTPCPGATNVPIIAGNYHYQWGGTNWSGTMTLNQSGPWLWGSFGLPVEITAPWFVANWDWPFYGGILSSNLTVRLMSLPGAGFEATGDPWMYRMPLTALSPLTFSGTLFNGSGVYASTCFTRSSDMTITKQ